MPFPANCPLCGFAAQAPDHFRGRSIRCPKCNNTFLAREPTAYRVAPNPAKPTGDLPHWLVDVEGAESPVPTARRPPRILGILALVFGGVGFALALVGCVLYLVLWLTFDDVEKVAVVYGLDDPRTGILLLPKILNYLAIPLGVAGIVLGILSLCFEWQKVLGVWGISLGAFALACLAAFWVWTVARRPEIKLPGLRDRSAHLVGRTSGPHFASWP
jgi:hypothetical protein